MNNLGGTSCLELNIVAKEAVQYLSKVFLVVMDVTVLMVR